LRFLLVDRIVELESGKSVVLITDFDVQRVAVGNPKKAGIVLTNPRTIQVVAGEPGGTNILLWDDSGALQTALDLQGEGEAQKRPNHDHEGEHGNARQRVCYDDRANDVTGDQEFQPEDDRAADHAAILLVGGLRRIGAPSE